MGKKIFKIEDITKERLEELIKNPAIVKESDNKAIRGNFALYAAGVALSTFALAVLIPKVQYLIRNKLTHKDQFPGDDGYKVESESK